MKAEKLPETVSASELAEVWAVTPERVRQLAKSGTIPVGERGRYPCKRTLLAFAVYQRGLAERARSQGSDGNRAKLARAREIELRIAQREGELIEADAACAAMMTLAGTVRSSLDGLPARFTRDLRERDRLRKEIDDILEGVARALDVAGQAVRTGGGGDTPVAEDDA